MSRNNNNKEDSRPVYIAPQVIRLDNVSTGAGANCGGGSSPTAGNCTPTGNGASKGTCSPNGNGGAPPNTILQSPTPK